MYYNSYLPIEVDKLNGSSSRITNANVVVVTPKIETEPLGVSADHFNWSKGIVELKDTHVPVKQNSKIPFWIMQRLALIVKLEPNKEEALNKCKNLSASHGVQHLIDWTTFIQSVQIMESQK